MMELLTAAQMRAIEQAAIERGAVTGLELMERAGRGVVEAVFAEWPEMAKTPLKAVVLCGPGNNGGDGFVVARLLKDWGWEVSVYLYGEASKLPPDAKTNYERWRAMGQVAPLTEEEINNHDLRSNVAVLIDALFGIGLSRGVKLPIGDLWCDPGVGQAHKLVSIDVPSGLCADSGRVLAVEGHTAQAVPTDITVTFHGPKPGHYLADGPALCSKLYVVDIGLSQMHGRENTRLIDGQDALSPAMVGEGLEKQSGHKYDHGHALVLSGPMGRSGAARLAARAALRVGAGLVTVGAPGSAMMECACQLTATMLRKVDDAEALSDLLQDARFTALCLGPGLGFDRARDLVPLVLQSGRALVLDADALSAFAGAADSLFAHLHDRVVLTPHAGEFAKLFPDLAAKLADPAIKGPAYSKPDATREAAARAGATILFKGPDTVIASPDGTTAIHSAAYDRAAPWLATAGSGDILSGLITGLLARGMAAQSAAETAAWLHVEAARAFGSGLIAEDLPDMVPAVIGGLASFR